MNPRVFGSFTLYIENETGSKWINNENLSERNCLHIIGGQGIQIYTAYVCTFLTVQLEFKAICFHSIWFHFKCTNQAMGERHLLIGNIIIQYNSSACSSHCILVLSHVLFVTSSQHSANRRKPLLFQ